MHKNHSNEFQGRKEAGDIKIKHADRRYSSLLRSYQRAKRGGTMITGAELRLMRREIWRPWFRTNRPGERLSTVSFRFGGVANGINSISAPKKLLLPLEPLNKPYRRPIQRDRFCRDYESELLPTGHMFRYTLLLES